MEIEGWIQKDPGFHGAYSPVKTRILQYPLAGRPLGINFPDQQGKYRSRYNGLDLQDK